MHILILITIATSIVGLIGLAGVFALFVRKSLLQKLILLLVAFAAGALLAGGFFHLLAESLEHMPVERAFTYLVAGFVIFFFLEKLLFWHHCHKNTCPVHPFSYLILLGDGLHNMIDGVVVAASFLLSIKLGIITTILIITHEIPQELGNFGVLVHGGFSKFKALAYSFAAQLTCIIGGVLGYLASGAAESLSSLLLPFAAGGFIYIAASDLIPEIHNQKHLVKSLGTFIFFLLGVTGIMALKLLLK